MTIFHEKTQKEFERVGPEDDTKGWTEDPAIRAETEGPALQTGDGGSTLSRELTSGPIPIPPLPPLFDEGPVSDRQPTSQGYPHNIRVTPVPTPPVVL